MEIDSQPAPALSGAKPLIHQTACVDDPCQIGNGTKIWHYSHIMSGATIGTNCNIGQNVFIADRVQIGSNVKIQNNVSLYEGCILEDDVFCGPSAVFTNVKNPRSAIVRKGQYRQTYVERGATIGANATIVCPIRIGRHAFIAAGAVATKDVAPYALMAGVPARRVGWVGRAGIPLQKHGDDSSAAWVCPETGERYRELDSERLELWAPNEAEGQSPSFGGNGTASGGRATAVTSRVPMSDLQSQFRQIESQIRTAVERVLQSQRFILGEEVEAFESEMAAYTGARYAVACASGSDALLLAAMALNLRPGDEVLTTAYSFVATAGALWRLGVRPVFCDIELAGFNLDPEPLEHHLTDRTRAILPVHLFGQCCEMGPLMDFARRHDLAVIEDAAQSLGARHQGAMAGTLGDVGCYSFFPSKNLGCFGDGGMIVTNHPDHAERLRVLRAHGAKKKYVHELVGINSRLDAIQAAVLRTKLPFLAEWIEARRLCASRYETLLRVALPPGRMLKSCDARSHEAPVGSVVVPEECGPNFHSYNQFVIRVASTVRDELREHLATRGIETAVYYPVPLNRQAVAKNVGDPGTGCPRALLASRETIALPIYAELEEEAQKRVVHALVEFLNAPSDRRK